MSTQPVRPRQATLSAWMIMVGSVFVVLSAFERVSGLTSLETRESVEGFLAVPPGDGLGLGTAEVLDALRVLTMTAAACATAAAVLGYYVLQRSRGARLALSVLAVPLFLTGMAVGGFVSAVVSAAVVVLWMQPTRAWFDGTEPPARPERARPDRDRSSDWGSSEASERRVEAPGTASPPSAEDQPAGGASEPRAWHGFGTPASADRPEGARHAAQSRSGQSPAAYSSASGGARPSSLVWACALTWAGTGLAAIGMGMVVLVVLVAPDFVLDQLRRNPQVGDRDLSASTLREAVVAAGVVVVVWSVVAAVVAGFAWRGAGWARLTLVVSASVAAALCLVSVLSGNVIVLVPLGICVATLVLLARPDARAFAARR
ncbi:hypothetical protein [Nocardioides deserti]|uniref:DUF4064 domain-containing protein n=1 Tax=Nocardioides deserti TaxID=1588644 RepID=A0ABR6UBI4_9ACTN|nr:hypothetical protein [Nocardioides deserti]MBC2961782.1 hypothetical protein [Nocardioides deserti]GGO79272.1 hypothetical protein GCM10012276_38630 [Nocardioides deserti]